MNTLQQDIEDLDRMVDGGADKDKIRSQIRLIAREVAALETDYASLAQAHSQSQEALVKLTENHSALIKSNQDANAAAMQKDSDEFHRIIRDSTLKH
jgi:hypothetical protein